MATFVVCPACAATYGGVVDSDCPACIGFGVLELAADPVARVGPRAVARAVERFLYSSTTCGRRDLADRVARLNTAGLLAAIEGAPDFNDDDWEPDPGDGSVGRSLIGRAAGRLLVDVGLVPARPKYVPPPDDRRVAAGSPVSPQHPVPEGVADLTTRRLRRRR